MKTKIIYISGNEIFNISDIRNAFEEVRIALNLDKDTVLFGVPVDKEDAGFGNSDSETTKTVDTVIPDTVIEPEPITDSEPLEETITETPVNDETLVEETSVPETKKRGRPRKIIETPVEQIEESTDETVVVEEPKEKIVPILSVLATKDEEPSDTGIEIIEDTEPEIIIDSKPVGETPEEFITEKESESLTAEIPEYQPDEDEAGLEKLLSAITPLQEDFLDDKTPEEKPQQEPEDNIDATLEQLATEFVASQDKIHEGTKSNGRSKIGKLRNILPFKQSKNKESQGLGDLFGWAGIAANDEDFSVPGFFTNAAGKK